MVMPRILITGANRGIGLALTLRFAQAGWQVDACCRAPDEADALRQLASSHAGRIAVRRVDVLDHTSIDALAREIDGAPLDILLNNAGIMNGGRHAGSSNRASQSFGSLDFDAWMDVMRVNLLGPARMTEVFADNVARSERKIIAFVSSIRASLADSDYGGMYHYRTSKTAVNMLMRSIAVELAPRDITAVALHPGWARTDMGGASAPVSVEASSEGLHRVLSGLSRAQTGRFLSWEGRELPW